MLALSDTALGYIGLAAARLPPNAREAWLQRLAARLEHAGTGQPVHALNLPPARHAELQARYRRRQRDGLLSLRILVDREALVRALVNRDAAG
jgi:hypothetical protein